jgi:hypothetical protein
LFARAFPHAIQAASKPKKKFVMDGTRQQMRERLNRATHGHELHVIELVQ